MSTYTKPCCKMGDLATGLPHDLGPSCLVVCLAIRKYGAGLKGLGLGFLQRRKLEAVPKCLLARDFR